MTLGEQKRVGERNKHLIVSIHRPRLCPLVKFRQSQGHATVLLGLCKQYRTAYKLIPTSGGLIPSLIAIFASELSHKGQEDRMKVIYLLSQKARQLILIPKSLSVCIYLYSVHYNGRPSTLFCEKGYGCTIVLC